MPSAMPENYGLTVLCPLRASPAVDGESPLVRVSEALRALPDGAASPFARLPMVHLARFGIITDLPYISTGKRKVLPRRRPEVLRRPYLMFCADLDGRRDDFLDAMCLDIPEAVDGIWRHCEGYPGLERTVFWRKYVVACEIDTTFLFAAYPGRTVEEVLRALMWRRALAEFQAARQDAPPETLREAYRELIAGLREAPTPARGAGDRP